jgi:hypothetical protein
MNTTFSDNVTSLANSLGDATLALTLDKVHAAMVAAYAARTPQHSKELLLSDFSPELGDIETVSEAVQDYIKSGYCDSDWTRCLKVLPLAHKAKSTKIHSPAWLIPFALELRSLPSDTHVKQLRWLTMDRYLIDSFGVHWTLDSLAEYSTQTSTLNFNVRLYSFPRLDFLLPLYQNIIAEFWAAITASRANYVYSAPQNYELQRAEPAAVLFFCDPEPECILRDGEPIRYQFSHTKHLLQHLDAFIKAGYIGIIYQKTGSAHVVETVCGNLQILFSLALHDVYQRFNIQVLCSIYPEDLLMHDKGGTFNIWIQPAVHWIEDPSFFPNYFLTVIQAAATRIDCVVTQNSRMVDLTRALLYLGGARISDPCLLDVPVSIWSDPEECTIQAARSLARERYGFSDSTIAIVNGGGAWHWTATDSFFDAFCRYARKNPGTNLRFVQMGLRQKGNLSHQEVVDAINATSNTYLDVMARRLAIIEEWDEASTLLPDVLAGFDVGFAVSKNTVEAFQAHRVRVTEYIEHGVIPIINNFDYMAKSLSAASFQVDVDAGFDTLFAELDQLSPLQLDSMKTALHTAKLELRERGNSMKVVRCAQNYAHTVASNRNRAVTVGKEVEQMLRIYRDHGFYTLNTTELNTSSSHPQKRCSNVSLPRAIRCHHRFWFSF